MLRTAALSVASLILAVLSLTPAASAANSGKVILGKTLPELKFTGVPLGDAIDFLRDSSGANIHVNWRALEILSVGRDTTVNLNLRSVTLRKCLDLLLSDTGLGGQLTYYVDENVIEITTRELADRQLFTKVYPVDDILMDIPDFAGPNLSLTDNTSGSSSGGGHGSGNGGGGNAGNSIINSQSSTSDEKGKTKSERADDLVKLVMETIQPDIWRENGGTATIRYFNGHLIVTAPRSVHEALGGPID